MPLPNTDTPELRNSYVREVPGQVESFRESELSVHMVSYVMCMYV